jgi:hypothetical protein
MTAKNGQQQAQAQQQPQPQKQQQQKPIQGSFGFASG